MEYKFVAYIPKSPLLDSIEYCEHTSNVEVHCFRYFFEKPTPYELSRTLVEIPEHISGLIENTHNVVTKYPGVWYDGVVTVPIWEIKTVAFILKEEEEE